MRWQDSESQFSDGEDATSRARESAAEWVPISSLKPWAKNPRKNEGEPVKAVMSSIKRFGFAAPIVARRADGEVIAGHTRLKAAEALGLKAVPVRWMDLDPVDAHLLALADNKLNEKADWDNAAVAEILSDYGLDDAALAGWDKDELDKLGGELDDSDIPAGDNYKEQYAVLVVCAGADEQESVYNRLVAEGLNCKVVVT